MEDAALERRIGKAEPATSLPQLLPNLNWQAVPLFPGGGCG